MRASEMAVGRRSGRLNEWWRRGMVGGHERGVPGIAGGVEQMTRREQAPDWVSGACLLVRRVDAEAAGLFDERYQLYTEDVDFCAAIRARGRTIRFTPAVEIVHLRGRSAASNPAATRDAYRQSRLAFYEKHHPFWAPLLRLYLRFVRSDK